jgi:topoisomerase-4 subunit A
MERFDSNKIWTAVLFDADQSYPYVKRFQFEESNKRQNFLGENELSSLYLLSAQTRPRIEVVFSGNDAFRSPLEIDVESYIGVKSFKAKGKRITTFEVGRINEIEPIESLPIIENEQITINHDSTDTDNRYDDSTDLFKLE